MAALMLSGGPAAAGGNVPAFGANAASASSWVAGGHAGYNWQQGSMLYGFETDFQGTNLNSRMTGGLTPSSGPASDFAKTSAMIDYYGTFRGRIGFTTGRWLFYGTGGAAYGNVNLASQFSTLAPTTAFDVSQPKFGWVVGAGLEYLWRPNWMLTLNYQYVDLGNVGISSFATGGGIVIGQMASVHAQFQTATIGFSYRFAPDGSPSPWAGGYAGGQVGGDWGDHAHAIYSSSRIGF
ncbi:outer membrane beta-barrel protein [Bradyrhizobium sp.]|uniref:outer membrane protein n=1 Tax=Bradyrhizobium sp. TaxID=376 RepID=UPI0025BD49E1|nr:outer membrane beta-barrel protein [Bradyrhizobium sp.]